MHFNHDFTARYHFLGMPDPFTAAVAAAVTGNSAAQAEYYQAYQQYYQQYYASQYAAQFYSSESSTNGDLANSGITSIAGGGTLVGDATVQQHAFVDAAASHLYARALQQGTGSHEYAPGILYHHPINQQFIFV